jgi:hypothetical protein
MTRGALVSREGLPRNLQELSFLSSVSRLRFAAALLVCACSSTPRASQKITVAPPAASSANTGPTAPLEMPAASGTAGSNAPTIATPMAEGTSATAGVSAAGSGAAGSPSGAGVAGAGAAGYGDNPAFPDIVFHMSGTIQAGAEAMFCAFAQMPTDTKTAVPSAESHYTPGSHHFLVFRSNLTSFPKGGDVAHVCGTTDTTVAVPGNSNGINAAEAVMGTTGSYYEAQTPDARRDLPPGVAHVFQPGEILVMTAHYLNTTDKTIDSQIEFRLHRMDPNDVKQEAGTFFLLDTQLYIPPNSAVTVTQTCPIPKDINLGLLWSHMHARGYSFRAWTDDQVATQQLGGDVYDQPGPDGWQEPHVQTYPYDPPVTIHAGSKLMFSCTFHNTTSQTFSFGQSAATAEMCLLHGMYWPRLDSATEQCLNGTSKNDSPVAIPLGDM